MPDITPDPDHFHDIGLSPRPARLDGVVDPFAVIPDQLDPNRLVERMHHLARRARARGHLPPADAALLCAMFDDLDVWCSAGGYYPSQWAPVEATSADTREAERALNRMRALVRFQGAADTITHDDAGHLLDAFEALARLLATGKAFLDDWSHPSEGALGDCAACGEICGVPFHATRIEGQPQMICHGCWTRR